MKICTNCNIEKEEIYFSIRSNYVDGLSYFCKECESIKRKASYFKDIEKSRNRTNNKRRERVLWIRQLKENIPCKDCNKVYEPHCMDYDHLPEKGVKYKNISTMILNNTPKSKILEEISKCELVCVLCHNTRTKNRLDQKYVNKKYTNTMLRNLDIINKAKDNKCIFCGVKRELHNMQFDHIDSRLKYKNISQLKNFKEKTLIEEMNKCQIICALCHRRKSIWEQRLDIYNKEININKEIVVKHINFEKQEKQCIKCSQILKFSNFSTHKKTKDKLNSWCKNCFNEYRRFKRKDK